MDSRIPIEWHECRLSVQYHVGYRSCHIGPVSCRLSVQCKLVIGPVACRLLVQYYVGCRSSTMSVVGPVLCRLSVQYYVGCQSSTMSVVGPVPCWFDGMMVVGSIPPRLNAILAVGPMPCRLHDVPVIAMSVVGPVPSRSNDNRTIYVISIISSLAWHVGCRSDAMAVCVGCMY